MLVHAAIQSVHGPTTAPYARPLPAAPEHPVIRDGRPVSSEPAQPTLQQSGNGRPSEGNTIPTEATQPQDAIPIPTVPKEHSPRKTPWPVRLPPGFEIEYPRQLRAQLKKFREARTPHEKDSARALALQSIFDAREQFGPLLDRSPLIKSAETEAHSTVGD
jgi:hypothetical protein